MSNGTNRTYVKNMEDPNKILLPSGNLVLIALRMDGSRYLVPLTLLDDLPLDLSHRSTIENIGKRVTWCVDCWPGSRSQISNRVEDGLVESVQSFPFQSPEQDLRYVNASSPRLDVILMVGYRVLDRRVKHPPSRSRRGSTRIIVRTLARLKST